MDREALLDPVTCASCHPDAYREWAASSHAYASDDPIFRAIVRRGQRELDGGLGGFCVACHAPTALREGATADGLDLDQVPRARLGVTCDYCHEVDAVNGDHNAALELADDGVMRGGFDDPVANPAHASAHSPLLDGRTAESSAMCGACHDVVTPAGVRVERSYVEWQASIFARAAPAGVGCAACHMMGKDGAAATGAGLPRRRLHDHGFPGIDQPLGAWPDRELLAAGIARDLGPSVSAKLCVRPGAGGLAADVTLDNVLSGHAWPSGVTHARRAWVELVARKDGAVVYTSGLVAPGGDPAELADPDLWLMRQKLIGPDGNEVAMPWEAARVEANLLGAAVTVDPQDPRFYHAVTHTYALPPADEIEVHLRITAIGAGVFRELERTGDLAPGLSAPILDVAPAARRWTAALGYTCQ